MIPLIEDKREALAALCRRYRVRRLDLFGSAATERFRPQASDIDLLVEFEPDSPMGPFSQYMGFLEEVKALFGRDVDLVEAQAMKNPYLIRAVNATRISLYAA
jgi:predicted nucleotidyltransferase